MTKWLSRLIAGLVLVYVTSYAWEHRPHRSITSPTEQTPEAEATDPQAQEAQKMITVTGPIADYLSRHTPAGAGTSGESSVETARYSPHRPSALDHVGDSPVGTSAAVLNKTFRIATVVDSPFEIPAHAASPQLRGTYHSFVQPQGTASSDDSADVEFLLLNQQQYTDFLNRRPSDALFSADSAHNGEVHVSLPPTRDHPAKYYLVFRNSSPSEGKKAVQADFRVDF
jgi:hypothetical protein